MMQASDLAIIDKHTSYYVHFNVYRKKGGTGKFNYTILYPSGQVNTGTISSDSSFYIVGYYVVTTFVEDGYVTVTLSDENGVQIGTKSFFYGETEEYHQY